MYQVIEKCPKCGDKYPDYVLDSFDAVHTSYWHCLTCNHKWDHRESITTTTVVS